MNEDWQPAIIAPREHTLKYHKVDTGAVSRHCGQKIRVRLCEEAEQCVAAEAFLQLGCKGRHLAVHPEDAERL